MNIVLKVSEENRKLVVHVHVYVTRVICNLFKQIIGNTIYFLWKLMNEQMFFVINFYILLQRQNLR